MSVLGSAGRKPSVYRRVADVAISLGVVFRSGLVNPLRPWHVVRTFRTAQSRGPVAAALTSALGRSPDSVAIIDENGALSFRELDTQSDALAYQLRIMGAKDGAVVGALCRDHRGMVLTLIAAGRAGLRLVLLNTGFAAPQLADVVAREGISLLLYDAEFEDVLEALPTSLARIHTWADDGTVDSAIPRLDQVVLREPPYALPAPARPGGIVLLTSGTTGTPKGAPRDRVSVLTSAQVLHRIPLRTGGTMVMAAPTFHGTGLAQLTLGMALGKTIVLQRSKFDPYATIQNVSAYGADTLVLVPTMLQRILELDPGFLASLDLSSLRIIFSAGSALSPEICRRTRKHFGDVLYNLYGSTEVAVASVASPEDLSRFPGAAGRPPVGCRVVLYDESRRAITQPHVRGTVFVGSAMSFSAYTDGRVKESINGLLCTGDIGHFDDHGLLFIDGREDDMIVSGGENVFPQEVEDLLAAHAGVSDVAVVGVDDEKFGKRLQAFIVRRPGASCTSLDLREYVRVNLARHKVPRDVVFVNELPRNATGKILRRQLELKSIAVESVRESQ